MSLGDERTFIEYSGDGAKVDFVFSFSFLSLENILVFVNKELVTTGYSIVNVDSARTSGTVRFNNPPANGVSIKISRILPYTFEEDFNRLSRLPVSAINLSFIKNTMLLQQLRDDIESRNPDPTSVFDTINTRFKVLEGVGPPGRSIGESGNVYFDTLNNIAYIKSSNTWHSLAADPPNLRQFFNGITYSSASNILTFGRPDGSRVRVDLSSLKSTVTVDSPLVRQKACLYDGDGEGPPSVGKLYNLETSVALYEEIEFVIETHHDPDITFLVPNNIFDSSYILALDRGESAEDEITIWAWSSPTSSLVNNLCLQVMSDTQFKLKHAEEDNDGNIRPQIRKIYGINYKPLETTIYYGFTVSSTKLADDALKTATLTSVDSAPNRNERLGSLDKGIRLIFGPTTAAGFFSPWIAIPSSILGTHFYDDNFTNTAGNYIVSGNVTLENVQHTVLTLKAENSSSSGSRITQIVKTLD